MLHRIFLVLEGLVVFLDFILFFLNVSACEGSGKWQLF